MSQGIPLRWRCVTLTGQAHVDEDTLTIEQQRARPDWDSLLEDQPYTLNPIAERRDLFGRDQTLDLLLSHALGGTSTFLWGQKRVGKTSVLQVLTSELETRNGFACVVLRMGEIRGFHEGQIGHLIAKRLVERAPGLNVVVPDEQSFSSNLGGLVPFLDQLKRAAPRLRFIVIIDEFDDLTPSRHRAASLILGILAWQPTARFTFMTHTTTASSNFALTVVTGANSGSLPSRGLASPLITEFISASRRRGA